MARTVTILRRRQWRLPPPVCHTAHAATRIATAGKSTDYARVSISQPTYIDYRYRLQESRVMLCRVYVILKNYGAHTPAPLASPSRTGARFRMMPPPS